MGGAVGFYSCLRQTSSGFVGSVCVSLRWDCWWLGRKIRIRLTPKASLIFFRPNITPPATSDWRFRALCWRFVFGRGGEWLRPGFWGIGLLCLCAIAACRSGFAGGFCVGCRLAKGKGLRGRRRSGDCHRSPPTPSERQNEVESRFPRSGRDVVSRTRTSRRVGKLGRIFPLAGVATSDEPMVCFRLGTQGQFRRCFERGYHSLRNRAGL